MPTWDWRCDVCGYVAPLTFKTVEEADAMIVYCDNVKCPKLLEPHRMTRVHGGAGATFKGLTALVLLLSLLMPATARAATDWTPVYVSLAGHSADVWSTYRFLRNGSGCVEGNPRLDPHPSTARLITFKLPVLGVTAVTAWAAGRPNAPRWLKGTSKVLGYYGGAQGGYDAVRNLSLCGW